MKKTFFIAIAIPICIGLGNPAIADDVQPATMGEPHSSFFSSVFKSHFEKDFSASVGLKTWINEWNLPMVIGTGTNHAYYSEPSVGFIPLLSARYKNFVISGSYFLKTDYDFDSQTVVNYYIDDNNNQVNYLLEDSAIKGERSEWDINVGYYIQPSIVVSLGYKNIDRDIILKSPYLKNDLTTDQNTSGLTLGISAVAPLQGQWGLYGNFALGWLETEWKYGWKYDTDYYLGELGFVYGYRLDNIQALESVSVHIGYRFQALIDDNTLTLGVDTTNTTDYTQGFVLGVNLAF